MVTCPDTHGIFHSQIDEIARLIHSVDGLMYYDGANLNAVLGRFRPGDVGFDVMHINLHKTFSTPHGGGGPGAGPVGVNKKLAPYLPISRVIKKKTVPTRSITITLNQSVISRRFTATSPSSCGLTPTRCFWAKKA